MNDNTNLPLAMIWSMTAVPKRRNKKNIHTNVYIFLLSSYFKLITIYNDARDELE